MFTFEFAQSGSPVFSANGEGVVSPPVTMHSKISLICSGIFVRPLEALLDLSPAAYSAFPGPVMDPERVFRPLKSEVLSRETHSSLGQVDTKELFKELFIKKGLEILCNFGLVALSGLGLLFATLSIKLSIKEESTGSTKLWVSLAFPLWANFEFW